MSPAVRVAGGVPSSVAAVAGHGLEISLATRFKICLSQAAAIPGVPLGA
jgi:hypothetical protein